MGEILRKFLARYSVASTKVMFYHFGMGPPTVKEVLSRELGFRKYAGRWVPHLLDDAQKRRQRASAIKLLESLRGWGAYDFDGIATGDGSWFRYHYELCQVFAGSREKVASFVQTQQRVQKVIGCSLILYPNLLRIW
jgi:hypothetical protein